MWYNERIATNALDEQKFQEDKTMEQKMTEHLALEITHWDPRPNWMDSNFRAIYIK
mgnify:CR=1 FL=1